MQAACSSYLQMISTSSAAAEDQILYRILGPATTPFSPSGRKSALQTRRSPLRTDSKRKAWLRLRRSGLAALCAALPMESESRLHWLRANTRDFHDNINRVIVPWSSWEVIVRHDSDAVLDGVSRPFDGMLLAGAQHADSRTGRVPVQHGTTGARRTTVRAWHAPCHILCRRHRLDGSSDAGLRRVCRNQSSSGQPSKLRLYSAGARTMFSLVKAMSKEDVHPNLSQHYIL